MHSTLRNCVFRLVIVAGVAIGATLVIVTIVRSSPRALLVPGHVCWLPRLSSVWCSGPVKRNLQGIDQPPAFHEDNQGWPRREYRRDSYEHQHYLHRLQEDDNDDSEDENDDDDDDSESRSQSGSDSSGREAAVQSSVISNMDGVNIGNTITIINIGTGSEASASEPGDNIPKVNTSGSFSISENGRSAITSAAVRAFCDSMGCNPFPSKVTPNRSRSPALSTISSVNGGNEARGNAAQNQLPQRNCGGQPAKFSSWLLFIAILVQLRYF
ncbi:hypothetical protein V7S43_014061 [Phytophthora oleae]|uniref:Uncharacterized protein n=1 Tax=Phytophthora oleae TaxID=2107226 RepID=A0ABD3F6H3_9STRA